MPKSLHVRKQDLVRDAIFDAAIDLLVRDGLDATTLEDISKAAGVSARTLYRYFATRDELLAHRVNGYGKRLVASVQECPHKLSPLDTIQHAAVDATAWAISQPRMREVIDIGSKYPSVRQAQQSVLAEIQGFLAEAFVARFRKASKDDLKPRLYASVTLMIVQRSVALWYHGDSVEAGAAVKEVMKQLTSMFCEG